MVEMRRHLSRHPCAIELGRRFRPSPSGAVSDVGIDLMRALGFTGDEALHRYRVVVWSVFGFAMMERGVETSVHHTPVGDRPSSYRVHVLDDEGHDLGVLDVEALFTTVVDVVVAGLVAAAPTPTPTPTPAPRGARAAPRPAVTLVRRRCSGWKSWGPMCTVACSSHITTSPGRHLCR